jgi:cytochrome c553
LKTFYKWTGFVVAALAVVALIALTWIYFASEREFGRHYTAADHATLSLPTAITDIAEGERIAQLGGCLHCHGEKLTGTVVDDIPHLVRLVAPNISVALPAYSDAQLATVLRSGIKPDGSSVLFMPSEMFRHFSDQELARVIAYLRTVPATPDGIQERTQVRILGRLIVAKGDYQPPARAIEGLAAPVREYTDDAVSRGRHLAMAFCSECHGQNLEGFAPINAPPLKVAQGYSADQFARLMHEGVALGDRELKLMGSTARARFSKFTADEISAVYGYLRTL